VNNTFGWIVFLLSTEVGTLSLSLSLPFPFSEVILSLLFPSALDTDFACVFDFEAAVSDNADASGSGDG